MAFSPDALIHSREDVTPNCNSQELHLPFGSSLGPNTGHLGRNKEQFNFCLTKCRMAVTHVFGRQKNPSTNVNWRDLMTSLDPRKPNAHRVIPAHCILLNSHETKKGRFQQGGGRKRKNHLLILTARHKDNYKSMLQYSTMGNGFKSTIGHCAGIVNILLLCYNPVRDANLFCKTK